MGLIPKGCGTQPYPGGGIHHLTTKVLTLQEVVDQSQVPGHAEHGLPDGHGAVPNLDPCGDHIEGAEGGNSDALERKGRAKGEQLWSSWITPMDGDTTLAPSLSRKGHSWGGFPAFWNGGKQRQPTRPIHGMHEEDPGVSLAPGAGRAAGGWRQPPRPIRLFALGRQRESGNRAGAIPIGKRPQLWRLPTPAALTTELGLSPSQNSSRGGLVLPGCSSVVIPMEALIPVLIPRNAGLRGCGEVGAAVSQGPCGTVVTAAVEGGVA
ncbi:uncharacterized protein AAGF69_017380 [Amazona ochrocephala]